MNDRLHTVRPVAAVTVSDEEGPVGPIREIPSDAEVQLFGPSALPGMVDISWNGQKYAVFAVDLEQRTSPATTSR